MSEGIRSVAQSWLGGSGSVPVVSGKGVRSMQAFWMGGSAQVGIMPLVPAVTGGSGGGRSSWEPEPRKWAEYTRERQRRYDEVFKKLLAAEIALETAREAIAAKSTALAYTAKERLRLRPLEERVVKLKAQLEKLEESLGEEHLMIALFMS